MASTNHEVLLVDEIITAISEARDLPAIPDLAHYGTVFAALRALAVSVDLPAMPELAAGPTPASPKTLRWKVTALAAGGALAFTTSGLAAAVTGSHLAPVDYIIDKVEDLTDAGQDPDPASKPRGAGEFERGTADAPTLPAEGDRAIRTAPLTRLAPAPVQPDGNRRAIDPDEPLTEAVQRTDEGPDGSTPDPGPTDVIPGPVDDPAAPDAPAAPDEPAPPDDPAAPDEQAPTEEKSPTDDSRGKREPGAETDPAKQDETEPTPPGRRAPHKHLAQQPPAGQHTISMDGEAPQPEGLGAPVTGMPPDTGPPLNPAQLQRDLAP